MNPLRSVTACACGCALYAMTAAVADPARLILLPEGNTPTLERTRLLGTNAALWYEQADLQDTGIARWLDILNPAFLRMPGGSWSDEIHWNGNGVRNGDSFNTAKRDGHTWQVDYSGYAPGFRLANVQGDLADYHGNLDVLTLHRFIEREGAHAVVTVNAGTGTPEMAAEWVRWANQTMGFGVKYWEIGNELEGAWELGHRLADGRPLTGEHYAERFAAFATAMKAVDPSIRVGGPAASNLRGGFARELLRLAGDQVDFLSFHTYPVSRSTGSDDEFFQAIDQLGPAMDTFRGWIREFQPERIGDIEIAITEWNSKVLEDRDTGDLLNGLWTAAFIGELFRQGVSFATQWDMLTRTGEGGHGLFARSEGQWVPTAQYWSMYLWSQYMGNQWVQHRLEGASSLRAVTTLAPDRLQVMLINPSRTDPGTVVLETHDGQPLPVRGGYQVTLSHREYFWDPVAHQPRWSRHPDIAPLGETDVLTVPPYAVRVFVVPLHGATLSPPTPGPAREGSPLLEVLLPKRAAGDLPVEGWVLADGILDTTASLTVTGTATPDVRTVRIAEGAGRFYLTPQGPGPVSVQAAAGSLQASGTVIVNPVEEREEIAWRFERPRDSWNADSSFILRRDGEIRPNQHVAAVDLDGRAPGQDRDILINLTRLPESLEKSRIRGVVFDLWIPPGIRCDDPSTAIRPVLQSEGDHWIPLGSVPLKGASDGWQTLRFPLPTPEHVAVMNTTYALRLQLVQAASAKTPVHGTLYLDNLGFILR